MVRCCLPLWLAELEHDHCNPCLLYNHVAYRGDRTRPHSRVIKLRIRETNSPYQQLIFILTCGSYDPCTSTPTNLHFPMSSVLCWWTVHPSMFSLFCLCAIITASMFLPESMFLALSRLFSCIVKSHYRTTLKLRPLYC